MIALALLVPLAITAQLLAADAGSTFAAPFAEQEVPDPVLADQRGGIRLPSGIDVTLSIDTVTALDGKIVLQTVTKIADGAPVVTAFAPGEGTSVALPQRTGANSGSALVQPRVTYDRQHGLTVTGGTSTVPVTVASNGSGSGGTDAVAPALQQLDLTHSATTVNGVVQARGEAGRGGVELQGLGIDIVHLTGNAYGSAIANTGSDRAIDTQTTLSIDLRNAGPDVLGSAMLRVEDVALQAVGSRF